MNEATRARLAVQYEDAYYGVMGCVTALEVQTDMMYGEGFSADRLVQMRALLDALKALCEGFTLPARVRV